MRKRIILTVVAVSLGLLGLWAYPTFVFMFDSWSIRVVRPDHGEPGVFLESISADGRIGISVHCPDYFVILRRIEPDALALREGVEIEWDGDDAQDYASLWSEEGLILSSDEHFLSRLRQHRRLRISATDLIGQPVTDEVSLWGLDQKLDWLNCTARQP